MTKIIIVTPVSLLGLISQEVAETLKLTIGNQDLMETIETNFEVLITNLIKIIMILKISAIVAENG